MIIRRFLSAAIAVLAVAAAIITVCTVSIALQSEPRMLQISAEAITTAQNLMDAICRGDDVAITAQLHGNPKLSLVPVSENPAVELLWNAYQNSLTHSPIDSCTPTLSGVAVEVTVEALDSEDVLDRFAARAQALLEERTASRSHSELYDENDQLLPEQAAKLSYDAMLLALGDECPVRKQTISLNLHYVDGKWQVLPEDSLLNLLSGSTIPREVPNV